MNIPFELFLAWSVEFLFSTERIAHSAISPLVASSSVLGFIALRAFVIGRRTGSVFASAVSASAWACGLAVVVGLLVLATNGRSEGPGLLFIPVVLAIVYQLPAIFVGVMAGLLGKTVRAV